MIQPLWLNLEQHDRLSEHEKGVLERAVTHTRVVERGEDAVREHDRPAESLVLLEGFAARYKLLREGKRQITSLHLRGDFVDLHSFYLKSMDHGVAALTPSRFGVVPHEALRAIKENHPHLARLLTLTIAIDGAAHRQWLAMTGRPSARSRFAHLICEVYLRLRAVGQTRGYAFDLPLSQSDLGDVLGLSTVHVNRTLQDLRRDGLVTWHRHAVTIDDWDRLRAVAEFDPAYLNLDPEHR